MNTELTQKDDRRLESHRYYELRHFCLQYPEWKKLRAELDGFAQTSAADKPVSRTIDISSPVENCVEKRKFYTDRIEMVEKAANETSPTLAPYILKAVTEDYSYDYLSTVLDIPCCRSVYYKMYRRFFRLLDRARE